MADWPSGGQAGTSAGFTRPCLRGDRREYRHAEPGGDGARVVYVGCGRLYPLPGRDGTGL